MIELNNEVLNKKVMEAFKNNDSKPLLFFNRVPFLDVEESEVTKQETAKVFAADMSVTKSIPEIKIGKVEVHEAGGFEFVTTSIPKIKIGKFVDENTSLDYLANNLARGLKDRINWLNISMLLDEINYQNYGINLNGSTWGCPPDLKWESNEEDVLDLIKNKLIFAADTYGEHYDTLIMSSKAFKFLLSTSSFLKKNSLDLNSTAGIAKALEDLSKFLDKNIDVYDLTYNEIENSTVISKRYLPVNKVLFLDSKDYKTAKAYDFANTTVTETILNKKDTIKAFGPVSFFQKENSDTEKEIIVAYSSIKGYPRKHRETASATLTIKEIK